MSELVSVGAPDGAVHGVTGMSGRQYRSSDGMYRMTPRDAAALVKAGGFRPNLGQVRAAGFPCGECGFQSLFRLCSRCGATNRGGDDAAPRAHPQAPC